MSCRGPFQARIAPEGTDMDQNDRQIIDDLFGKLRQAEQQTGPRDAESERYIADQVTRSPAAPYYMAQAIVIQEQALAAAHERIQKLEQDLANRPAGGGFLAGLFGGGRQQAPAPARRPAQGYGQGQGYGAPGAGGAMGQGMAGQGMAGQGMSGSPWGGRPGGGSFMGGALQTAMAVAGGIVVGNMIADMLTPDPAMAAEPEPEADPGAEEDVYAEEPADDFGADFGDEEF